MVGETMMNRVWIALERAGILRVTREDELAGLDLVEHGEIEGE